MKKKQTIIKLLTEAAAAYVFTTGVWNHPYSPK